MKNWGIQTRILLLALAPAVAVAGALSVYFVLALLSDLDRDLRDRGLGLARQLAAIAEYSTYSGDRQTLGNVALAALEEAHVNSVEVYDQEGEALAASGALPAPLSPLPSLTQSDVIHEDEDHLRIAAPVLRHRFDIQDPFLAEPPVAGRPEPPPLLGWVVVEMSRQSLETRRQETIAFTLTLVLLTVAATSLLAMILTRQVSRPIVRLEKAVERIRAGQLNLQLPADSGGDLQRLEEGFNTMAQALQEARDNLEGKIADATRELERKRAEAERSSLAKSRFLAAASHDLRQPLHALNLFASDLKNHARGPDQEKLAGQIGTSIRSMSELLDALLNISRLDVAGVNPQPLATPLQAIFDKLQQTYAREAENRGLRLRFRPTRAWAHTDPALVERLLGNLITNALRYTERGSILVAARRRGQAWRIEVRDSGDGIAPEFQRAVFEEFVQVGNAERGQGKGLGLGLAIVDRLAKAMETPLDLRSALGQGSVFAVQLPACAAVAETPAAEQEKRLPLAALLAYGPGFMADSAEQLEAWLRDWGLRCRRVESAAAAQALLAEMAAGSEGPFLWLTPGNGTTLREVLALAPERPAVIIGGEEQEGMADGGWFSLPHPARPAKLRALLQRLAGELEKTENA